MTENTPSLESASDESVKQKPRSSRKLFAFLILLCVVMGVITLRVNSQRSTKKWAEDLGGSVVYHIERGEKNQFLSPEEMKAKPGGFMLNVVGIDYVSAIKEINLPEAEITDIEPLSKLSDLEVVRILPNKITTLLPLSKSNTLKRLEISDNPVSTQPIAKAPTSLRKSSTFPFPLSRPQGSYLQRKYTPAPRYPALFVMLKFK